MHKFVIKNRKKRRYTKKLKQVSSYLLPNAFYGFLPLLIILIAFMATYFMSSSFKTAIFHIKTFYELRTSPSISVIYLLNKYRNIVIDTARFTSFLIQSIGIVISTCYISLVKLNTLLIHVNQDFNLYFFIKPINSLLLFSNSFRNFVIIQSDILYNSNKNISTSFLTSIANNIDHLNVGHLLTTFYSLFKTIVSQLTFSTTITIKILTKSSFYSYESLFNTAVFTRGLCIYSIYFIITWFGEIIFTLSKIIVYIMSNLIPPTISASKYINHVIQSYSIIIYNSLIININSVLELFKNAITTTHLLISSFVNAIIHITNSISDTLLRLISAPFIALNEGYIQLHPYILILNNHLVLAGTDLINCFKSFDKLSYLVKSHN